MSDNVQLAARERCVVYLEKKTRRILGFGSESIRPHFPKGTHYLAETLFHSWDMDRWSEKFRQQWRQDQEIANYNQVLREQPMRDAIKSALRARNQHVNPLNRALNETMMRVMDRQYEQALAAKLRSEVTLTAERFDASKYPEDIAVTDPAFRSKVN